MRPKRTETINRRRRPLLLETLEDRRLLAAGPSQDLGVSGILDVRLDPLVNVSDVKDFVTLATGDIVSRADSTEDYHHELTFHIFNDPLDDDDDAYTEIDLTDLDDGDVITYLPDASSTVIAVEIGGAVEVKSAPHDGSGVVDVVTVDILRDAFDEIDEEVPIRISSDIQVDPLNGLVVTTVEILNASPAQRWLISNTLDGQNLRRLDLDLTSFDFKIHESSLFILGEATLYGAPTDFSEPPTMFSHEDHVVIPGDVPGGFVQVSNGGEWYSYFADVDGTRWRYVARSDGSVAPFPVGEAVSGPGFPEGIFVNENYFVSRQEGVFSYNLNERTMCQRRGDFHPGLVPGPNSFSVRAFQSLQLHAFEFQLSDCSFTEVSPNLAPNTHVVEVFGNPFPTWLLPGPCFFTGRSNPETSAWENGLACSDGRSLIEPGGVKQGPKSSELSPDGRTLVFLGDYEKVVGPWEHPEHLGPPELFSLDLLTGVIEVVSGPTNGGGVLGFGITPDGAVIANAAEGVEAGVHRLFRHSKDTDGERKTTPVSEEPFRARDSFVDDSKGIDFRIARDISPTAAAVMFLTDINAPQSIRLIHRELPRTGGANALDNHLIAFGDPAVDGGDVQSFRVHESAERVVFTGDLDTDNVTEIYSAPYTGERAAKLNPDLTTGNILSYSISPDGSRVLFDMDATGTGQQRQLHSSLIEGGGSMQLAPATAAADQRISELPTGSRILGGGITADSGHVVFLASSPSRVFDLYSVPIEGGEIINLTNLQGNSDVQFGVRPVSFIISPIPGGGVFYFADQEQDGLIELFHVPAEGGESVKLNGDLPTGGTVSNFSVSPDGRYVVYMASQDEANVTELYAVKSTGDAEPVKLSGALVAGGNVVDFSFTPDSSQIVYRADQETDETTELYVVPTAGGSDPVRVNDVLVDGGNVESGYKISPDSGVVVYLSDQETDGIVELFGKRIASDSPAVAADETSIKLNGPLVEGGELWSRFRGADFEISHNSEFIVYLADQDTDDVSELYQSSLSDGFIKKVNGPLVEGGDVGHSRFSNAVAPPFQITPDNTGVVYFADKDVDDRIGVYFAPLVEPEVLAVAANEPSESGVAVEFNEAIDAEVLNLYDTVVAGAGTADVELIGATTGPVIGSLVVDSENNKVTFQKSGGPLEPDTYTLRLRSGDDGFKTVDGLPLDGDGDGTVGGDFETTFTIDTASGAPVVSIPDFVRGPGQDVNLPADTTNGIPLTVSDTAGLRAAEIRIDFDPALLAITEAAVAVTAPEGAAVELDTSTAGTAVVRFTTPSELPDGENVLVNVVAMVPTADAAANYGRQQVLDVHSVVLTDSEANVIESIADDALHLVMYFGDGSGDRRINAGDAAAVAQQAALINSGFGGALNTDPTVVGDLSGNRRVNAGDAAILARWAALFPEPQIPSIPNGVFADDFRIGAGFGARRDAAASDSKERERVEVAELGWADVEPLPYAAVDEAMLDIAERGEGLAELADWNSQADIEDLFVA